MTDDTTVITFRNNDECYLAWVGRNPDGWVLNKDTASPVPKLHRADCGTICTPDEPRTINGLIKSCSADRDALVAYARVGYVRPPSFGCPACRP